MFIGMSASALGILLRIGNGYACLAKPLRGKCTGKGLYMKDLLERGMAQAPLV
jgi:hypothetical protein